jgi:hypothetical protein
MWLYCVSTIRGLVIGQKTEIIMYYPRCDEIYIPGGTLESVILCFKPSTSSLKDIKPISCEFRYRRMVESGNVEVSWRHHHQGKFQA